MSRLHTFLWFAAGLAGCSKEPDQHVLPEGRGWVCSLDECERSCTPRLQLVKEQGCLPQSTAFCMTYEAGATGQPAYYCASSRRACQDVYSAQQKGVLGERPARSVSVCVEVP